MAEGTEKGTLRRLHEAEIIGEVHDALHVGLGKLDPARHLEFTGHGELMDYSQAAAAGSLANDTP